MSISFGDIFGVHSQALSLRARRAEVLAGNLANVDTPGYKAKDLDFKAAMKTAIDEQTGSIHGTNLARTNDKHLVGQDNIFAAAEVFKRPLQPDTGDGNTVDVSSERMAYVENSIDYQATLTFLNTKIANLRRVMAE